MALKKYFYLLFFSLLGIFLKAQPNIDSTWNLALKYSEEEQFLAANLILDRLEEYHLEQADYFNFLKASLQAAINLQASEEDQEAIQHLNTTLQTFQQQDSEQTSTLPIDSIIALIYHKIGVGHYNLYEESKAIQAFKKSLTLRTKIFPKIHPSIAKSKFNIGVSYGELTQYTQAEPYFLETLQLYQNLKNEERVAASYWELGKIYERLGHIQKSKNYLLAAKNYYEKEEDPYALIPIYLGIANLYLRQDSAAALILYSQKALEELLEFEEKYDEDYFDIANAYNNLGLGYEINENYQQALIYHQQSLAINQKYPKERQDKIAYNYTNLGYLYMHQNQYDLAEDYLKKALEIDQKLNRKIELAEDYLALAQTYQRSKKYVFALETYQLALQQLLPNFTPQKYQDNPVISTNSVGDQKLLIEILAGKAETLQQGKTEDLPLALATYQLVNQQIDKARFEFQNEASKSFLLSTTKPIFANAIHVATTLFQQTKDKKYAALAFEFSERSKALILLEAVNDNKAKSLAGIPLELRKKEQSLNQKITYFSQELFTQRNAATLDLNLINTLNDSLLRYNLDLEKFIKSIEADYPQYYQLKYAFQPISVVDIQEKILHPTQAMIEYFVGEKHIYIFKINNKDIDIYIVKNDFPLAEWINEFRYSITANFSGERMNFEVLDSLYNNRAFQLYEKLWLPLIHKEALPTELIIVPDGILGYIPFAALLSQKVAKEATGKYYTYPFLLKNHQISYTYSATLLQELKRPLIAAKKAELLAFAPTFGKTALKLAANDRSGLSPLLHNQREVKSVIDLFGGQSFLGIDASRQNFIQTASNYRYLHLSSHARMNDQNPEYSYISFTQPKDDSLDQTALLYVDDLYNIPLQADMVVLSACETALGKLNRGEGIISLARAFSYAGARSIITTLWRVNDQKSADLIIEFYRQLIHERQSKDAALRAAQLAFVEEGTAAHPYYWAGFVGIGDMGVIEQREFKYWWLTGAIISLFLLGFVLKKRYSPIKKLDYKT